MPTTEQKPILVPIDFSNDAKQALLFAAELAQDLKCPLIVMHAVHDPGESPGLYTKKQTKKRLRKLEDIAADMLSEFIHKTHQKHPKLKLLKKPKTCLVTGLPVMRILEMSEKLQPRILIMGSQGRTGLKRALIGSKSEQVIRLSSVPVTIVRHRAS